jgi:Fic family protein
MSYQPQFTVTPALLARVEAIAALRERILGAAVQVAWIPALQKDARVRNAHSSTAIEGNPLTLEDVRAVEQGAPLPVPARAKREVVNYFAALRHIEQHAEKKPLTHEDVLRLHAIMAGEVMDQGEAGRYRTMRVRVGAYVPATGGRFGPDVRAAGMVEPGVCAAVAGVEFSHCASPLRGDPSVCRWQRAHGTGAGAVGALPARL